MVSFPGGSACLEEGVQGAVLGVRSVSAVGRGRQGGHELRPGHERLGLGHDGCDGGADGGAERPQGGAEGGDEAVLRVGRRVGGRVGAGVGRDTRTSSATWGNRQKTGKARRSGTAVDIADLTAGAVEARRAALGWAGGACVGREGEGALRSIVEG